MKIFYFLIILFIIGCESNSHNKNTKKKENNQIKTTTITTKNGNTEIYINDIKLVFKNNKLIYPKKRVILLFGNNQLYSKEEEKVLKKLKLKFYKTNNNFLEKYFNITIYPTIIILDKNKTIKYENFTPYEILKAEGF